MSDKPRILLIDDDDLDREHVRRLLAETCDVTEASNAGDGLRLATHLKPDCVLLDYHLPDQSGLVMLPEFVELTLPVVLLTGQGNEAVAVQALKQGAMDYLSKDALTIDSLRSSIVNVLNRAELERRLRMKQQELEQFVAVASHDLKSPLRTVSLLLENLLERTRDKLPQESLSVLAAIAGDLERMYDLVESLLEYSRIGRGDRPPGQVDLNTIMLLVTDSLQSAIEETGARIEYGDLPTVTSHRISLLQLLQNLVGNAIKFHEGNTPVVKVTATVEDCQLVVAVQDNGIGIPPENHEDIFAPFRRLHGPNEYEGSGIGLAACQRILDSHGGTIQVDSQLGEGAVFEFSLPL